MKKTIMASALLLSCFSAGSVMAANLVCDVYPKSGGHSWGNGTSSCTALDFSFGNSTNGKFYIQNISKPVNQIIWNGDANCTGGTTCNVTVRAYSPMQANALILYTDGTYEQTNSANMDYETGH